MFARRAGIIVAHPSKRSFKPDDLEFLDWIKKAFEEKLLTAAYPK
jgi:hypothetical protein